MFEKFQNLVSDFVERMRNPAQASRTILATMLTVGLLGLTLDFSEIISAEKLQSRILLATAETAETEAPVAETASACAQTRASGNSEKLIDQFEASFSGILPGISRFLDKNITVSRKELLVRETMGQYAEIKYCIPRKKINDLVDENYNNVDDFLASYQQVLLHEEEEYPLSEINRQNITDILTKTTSAQKDLLETEKKLRENIEAAINSAIALDRWTGERIKSLTSKTNNIALSDTNKTLDTQTKIGNQNNIINSANSGISDTIANILTVDETLIRPVNRGGTYTTEPGVKAEKYSAGRDAGYVPIDTTIKYSKQTGFEDIAEIEVAGNQDLADLGITFGLLNLFEVKQLPAIMEELGIETSIYLGALYQVDPFVPGSEEALATTKNKIRAKMLGYYNEEFKDHICNLDPNADPDSKKCFGF